MPDQPEGGFGLYVHWPFCQAKCPYCDFNSHVSASVDHDSWRAGLTAALAALPGNLDGRRLDSIFFGGGTPSLMQPRTIGQVIENASEKFVFADDVEITLEANPTSVEAAKLADIRAAGVNRLSLGVQALNAADLRALGRLHSVEDALGALDAGRSTFENVSFDLIYARQNQTPAAWRKELRQALSFAPDHLSLYQLTIEPNTAFGARARVGKLDGLPSEDAAADMFHETQALCQADGLPAYEVSNHARLGRESRHNLIYWRGGDWAGIGPGAHGRLTLNGRRYGTTTELMPDLWLSKADQTPDLVEVPREEVAEEYLMMGLRIREGLSLTRYQQMSGTALPDDRIATMVDEGMLVRDGDRISATQAGMAVLNSLILWLSVG